MTPFPVSPSGNASPQQAVRAWVEDLVVGLEWCPFARREVMQGTVRYVETRATTDLGLLSALADEFRLLDDQADIETTLVIVPHMLGRFDDYLEFLAYMDPLLESVDRTGVYQVASFHPDYRFEGTEADDPSNWTNRSPWPLLHILREDSLSKAIAAWEDKHGPASGIPERNIASTREMGSNALRLLLERCMNAS
jgi:hypothetical protein